MNDLRFEQLALGMRAEFDAVITTDMVAGALRLRQGSDSPEKASRLPREIRRVTNRHSCGFSNADLHLPELFAQHRADFSTHLLRDGWTAQVVAKRVVD